MVSVSKAIVLTLALMVFISGAFGQDYVEEADAASSAQSSFVEGAIAGKQDASMNRAYLWGGLIAGPLGILAAAISDPKPDPQNVVMHEQAMGTDYAAGYSSSYSLESRKNNLNNAVAGFAITITTAAVLGYILSRGLPIAVME